MKKNILIIIAAVILIAVAGGAFYGGMLYKGSQSQQRGAQRLGNNGRFSAGNSVTAGDIIVKDSQSMTVKTRDGSSRIIFYSDTTEVGKFVTGNMGDIQVGNNVMVNGKTNSDGSITAQSIQIRPAAKANN